MGLGGTGVPLPGEAAGASKNCCCSCQECCAGLETNRQVLSEHDGLLHGVCGCVWGVYMEGCVGLFDVRNRSFCMGFGEEFRRFLRTGLLSLLRRRHGRAE
jgi:hypothetical protein